MVCCVIPGEYQHCCSLHLQLPDRCSSSPYSSCCTISVAQQQQPVAQKQPLWIKNAPNRLACLYYSHMNIRRGHPRDCPTQAFYKHTHTPLFLPWLGSPRVWLLLNHVIMWPQIYMYVVCHPTTKIWARPLFTVYLPVSVLCTTRHLHAGPILHHSTPHSYKMVIPVFQYTPLNCLQTPNSPPPTTGPIMRAGSLFSSVSPSFLGIRTVGSSLSLHVEEPGMT